MKFCTLVHPHLRRVFVCFGGGTPKCPKIGAIFWLSKSQLITIISKTVNRSITRQYKISMMGAFQKIKALVSCPQVHPHVKQNMSRFFAILSCIVKFKAL